LKNKPNFNGTYRPVIGSITSATPERDGVSGRNFMRLEKEVKKEIYKLLERMECCGDILWFERLQSGVVRHEGNYIWMCREGTPDFICVFINKMCFLTVLFIEAKREGIKAEPREGAQKEWKDKYGNLNGDMVYMIAQGEDDVKKKIRHLAFDRMGGIKFDNT
jgi:hypothetical protein